MRVQKPTRIGILGSGRVGRALATSLSKSEYKVCFGVRDENDFDAKEWILDHPEIEVKSVESCVEEADVVITCFRPEGLKAYTDRMGDLENKVLVDAMNSIMNKKAPFETTTHALEELTNCQNIVKCFNTTGSENLLHPDYGRQSLDLFISGTSQYAKDVAREMAARMGFGACYDLGGPEMYLLQEQLAMVWVRLSQGELGRDFGFKVLRR